MMGLYGFLPPKEAREKAAPAMARALAIDEGIAEANTTLGRLRFAFDHAWGEAEKIFREIAANMNSTFLAAIGLVATAVLRRLFHRVEVRGIERVAEWAKRQPVVLVPSHRSYFDFVLVSWLFYQNHLMPPHVAARENMAFGPFGFLFRRAGAFFLRRS